MDDGRDSLEFECQNCDARIKFVDVNKVTTQLQQYAPKLDSGQQAMLGSYVDVTQSGPQTARPSKAAGGFQGLTQIFELASTQTHVDHPLCAKCLDHVRRELQERTDAAEEQAKAYEEALHMLHEEQRKVAGMSDSDQPLTGLQSTHISEEQLLRQLEQAEREEQVELERSQRLEAELQQAQAELRDLAAQEAKLKAEEDEYWQRYSTLWLELQDSMEEIDAVATKTDVAARHLDALRQTSVLEDCFHIWFQDRFGTISGFRLGRWKEEVKWEEVNAAWGQAVLLLDMMTRMYPSFRWHAGVLKPMASHPEISDGKVDYKLYGPVNKMWSGPYDKAMTLYLSCLDAFARFAREKDAKLGRMAFALPNPVDAEKGTVRGYSIRYGSMVGNHDVWNKALKYMLVDLKLLLHWVTKDQGMVDAGSSIVPPQLSGSGVLPERAGLAASMAAGPSQGQGGPRGAFAGARSMFQGSFS